MVITSQFFSVVISSPLSVLGPDLQVFQIMNHPHLTKSCQTFVSLEFYTSEWDTTPLTVGTITLVLSI